jgi:hypothetical protein
MEQHQEQLGGFKPWRGVKRQQADERHYQQWICTPSDQRLHQNQLEQKPTEGRLEQWQLSRQNARCMDLLEKLGAREGETAGGLAEAKEWQP